MRIRPRLSLKFTIGAVIIFTLAFGMAAVSGSGAAGNTACERLLGEWQWFDNGAVTFTPDRKAVWRAPVTGQVGHTANWQCATHSGTLTIPWTNRFTDTMTLSPDGQRLQGRNQMGMSIWAQRRLASAADGVVLTTVDIGGQRIAKNLLALAKATTLAAKRWRRDAILVGVRLREEGRLKPNAFFVQFMFYSVSDGTGLWMDVHDTHTDTLQAQKVSWTTLPIPDGFKDLPTVIATARANGLRGPLKEAWLRVEQPKNRPAVLAWAVTAHGSGLEIDGVSGAAIDYDVTNFAEYVEDYNRQWQRAADALRRLMSGSPEPSTGFSVGSGTSSGSSGSSSSASDAAGSDSRRNTALQNAWGAGDMRAYDRIQKGQGTWSDCSRYGGC